MNRFKIEIKWTLIFTIALVLKLVTERVLGLHSYNIQSIYIADIVFVPVAFVIYFFAIKDKKKNFYNGTISWLQGLVCGTIIGVLVAFASPFVQILNHFVISPDYFKNLVQYAISDYNPNRVSTINDAYEQYNLKTYIIFSILTAAPLGMITAALVSLILMNSKNKLSDEKLDL